MKTRLPRHAVALAALFAGLLALTSAAIAQPPAGGGGGGGGQGGMRGMFGGGGGPGGGMMEPAMTSDQLAKYAGILKLTPDQHDAAKALFDGYFASHQGRADKARDAMASAREEFRETRDNTVWQKVAEQMRTAREDGDKAEKQLFEDVHSLLTADQQAAWTQVERTHRREAGMRRNQFSVSGERADVIAIVEKLKLPAEVHTQVAPALDAYAEELDREIVKRAELQAKSEGQGQRMFQMFRPGGEGADPEAMAEAEKAIKENRDAMVRVRDVNRKFARQLESVLPAEYSSEFAAEFKRASFPELYRERHVHRVLGKADTLDLTAEQHASLQAIKESFERDNATMAQRGEAAMEEDEASFTLTRMMGPGGFRGNEKLQEMRNERNTLDTNTEKKVKDLLTPEQQKLLPERRNNEGDGVRRDRGNQGRDNPQRQRRQRPGAEQPQAPSGGI